MIDRIRQLQGYFMSLGVSSSTLSLPTPKTIIIESHEITEADSVALFSKLISEHEIVDVSRDLFASGHYNVATSEAFKALDIYVCKKAGISVSGTKAMRQAFNAKSPILYWSDRIKSSEKDEQEGYEHIYAGAMLGIRNPLTHEFNWVTDDKTALDLINLAQHLLRKAKESNK